SPAGARGVAPGGATWESHPTRPRCALRGLRISCPRRQSRAEEMLMPTCETCGNDYAHTFTVTMNGDAHVFDSFECAVQKLAPRCATCDTRIIGHGVEGGGKRFCCAHCARKSGVESVRDHA